MKIKGLEELQKGLKELEDTKSVPLGELLSSEFLTANTKFSSVEQLFESSGFKVDSVEELEAIPDEKMDAHIRANSGFDSWQSMLAEAGREWAIKKMGFGR